MCLYAAAKYPGSQVTAVSNSKTQKKFIDEQCKQRGIKNLMVGLWRCVDACRWAGQTSHDCPQVDPVEVQALGRGLFTAVLGSGAWMSSAGCRA